MNRGDEAISVGLIDCRASLAMTREVIANITNINTTHLSEPGQGDEQSTEGSGDKGKRFRRGVSKLRFHRSLLMFCFCFLFCLSSFQSSKAQVISLQANSYGISLFELALQYLRRYGIFYIPLNSPA